MSLALHPIRNHLILTLFCVCITLSCKAPSANKTLSFEQLASNEIGKNYTVDFNALKTFALCKQTRTTDHVNSIFNYCVINIRENKVVYKGSYQQGSVKWVDNDNIEVTTTEKF
jgi:hypothetical protein